MKKYTCLTACICFIFLQPILACSTFFINKNGEMVFGRNYDWISDAGMICTNQKGLFKTSVKMKDGDAITWVSKYGSITFNQYGKEFPTGGMNEKGLVVELMWAEGTKYPTSDNRPAVGILQWLQYQLDNHETIEEVIASDEKMRISTTNVPLHYLIADANGHAATIEFYNGKLVAHSGKDLPFPVLTNNTYDQSLKTAIKAGVNTGNKNFAIPDNSLQRFTIACSMVKEFEQTQVSTHIIDYSFSILDKVSQGDFTKWSIVYDLKNKKIFFRTANYRDIKSVDFSSFDFSCNNNPRAANMNQRLKGDISKNMELFTDKLNHDIIQQASTESKERVTISEKEKQTLLTYTQSIKCKNQTDH